jgi:hypothetical protein
LRGTLSAFRPLMLFVAGKRILQTLRKKKSNRKLIGIGYLFGLTHHNIFGLSNRQRQLLGQAEKRLPSLTTTMPPREINDLAREYLAQHSERLKAEAEHAIATLF